MNVLMENYYTLISYNPAGPDAEAAKEIAEDAGLEIDATFSPGSWILDHGTEDL